MLSVTDELIALLLGGGTFIEGLTRLLYASECGCVDLRARDLHHLVLPLGVGPLEGELLVDGGGLPLV